MSAGYDVNGGRNHAPSIHVPQTPWSTVVKWVGKNWDPENNPHHSVIGLTGSGKTYLIVEGLLKPLCPMDRVVFFDSKMGTDKSLTNAPAMPCKLLPKNTWGNRRLGRQKEPFDAWHRVVLSMNRNEAQDQMTDTLNRIWREGDYVVVCDELRNLTDNQDPGLGMKGPINRLYMMGRSQRISLISGTQSPVWVPNTFFDQASFAWISKVPDETRQKRLLEVGGMTKHHLPLVASLQRRHWLLTADHGENMFRTTVKV